MKRDEAQGRFQPCPSSIKIGRVSNIDLEICVDTLDGALAAKSGGAARVELCSALSEGGLTPSAGLMRAAVGIGIPCFAMIRPRSGLFQFSEAEIEIMLTDVATARQAGLAGVVLGVQAADGGLNLDALARLRDAAVDMGVTLHRVIDVVPDPLVAVDQVASLGFNRILTSGAAPEAPDGVAMIKAMALRAGPGISVMPGCGLTHRNVAHVVRETGASEVHAACSVTLPEAQTFSDFDPPSGRLETDETLVRKMVAALRRESH